MQPHSLPAATLAVARERRIDGVLAAVVESLRAQDGVALARVWLAAVDGGCTVCRDTETEPVLHLVATAGTPLGTAEEWTTRLDGPFHRVRLGEGKIGKVGASGTGLLLHDMSGRSSWIAPPEWAARERILSFAAQALSADGEILGVVGVFSRSRIDAGAFGWLRAFAEHAGLALRHARVGALSAARAARLEAENACLREQERGAVYGDLVTDSRAGRRLLAQIEVAAASNAAVLVTGEPGTGKELVARRIHERSRRSRETFLKVECASASAERLRVLLAAGEPAGTLLLDDVDASSLAVQRMLVDVLDRPETAVGVRMIAATTRDLRAEVTVGRFREDLYLRLSVLVIVVPPLRERTADIGPLVERLLDDVCRRRRMPRPTIAHRDLRALERHAWPGNGRELAGVVERAVMTSIGGRARFDGIERAPADEVVPALDFRQRERANLEAALVRTSGRIYGPEGAARLLGIPPTTLASRVKALGIERRAAR